MSSDFQNVSSTLVLENRNQLRINGVEDVDNFDDYTICIKSELGDLTVTGEQLHITKLDTGSGELVLEGKIDTLIYNEPRQNKGGLFSKVFS